MKHIKLFVRDGVTFTHRPGEPFPVLAGIRPLLESLEIDGVQMTSVLVDSIEFGETNTPMVKLLVFPDSVEIVRLPVADGLAKEDE